MTFVARTSLLALLAAAPVLGACTVHETRIVEPSTTSAPAAATPVASNPAAPRPAAGQHPWYLHALTDLREARARLVAGGGAGQRQVDEREAIADVDRAIAAINQASIDDGMNPNANFPLDAKETVDGQLHRAVTALQAARTDVDHEEDNAYANGLKARAIAQIDDAIRKAQSGITAPAR